MSSRFFQLICLAVLLSFGYTHTPLAATFDGKPIRVTSEHWMFLTETPSADPEQLHHYLQSQSWGSFTELMQVGGEDGIARVDFDVSYSGNDSILLVAPRTAFEKTYFGLVKDQQLIVWQPSEALRPQNLGDFAISYGMVELTIDEPGRYQLLIKGPKFSLIQTMLNSSLYLKSQFIFEEFPQRYGFASTSVGAIAVIMIALLALMVYQFRLQMLFAFFIITGVFLRLIIVEGPYFINWIVDSQWWIVSLLPLASALYLGGALIYIAEDFKNSGWRKSYIFLAICGWEIILSALANTVTNISSNPIISAIGILVVPLGMGTATTLCFVRAIQCGFRERLFALVFGIFCIVSIVNHLSLFLDYQFSAHTSYVIANALGIYLLIEYILLLTRDYSSIKARKSAETVRLDLVSRLSHELRTPLNAIIGLSDLLKSSPNREVVDNYAQMIHQAGHNLLDLVNDVLDFSKLEKSSIQLESKAFRLDELIYDVFTVYLPNYNDDKSPILQIDIDVEHWRHFFLKGDPSRLRQVIFNMVGNAMKYSPPDKEILLNFNIRESSENHIEIHCQVIDQGRGIPKNKLASIFDPYTQALAEDSSSYRGTGLGLNISKNLIEAMGGRIDVESVEGEGSTFSFTVCLAQDTNHPDLNQKFAPLKNKNVLFLSEALPFFIFAELAKQWQVNTTTANSYEEVTNQTFDVILVDHIHENRDLADEQRWLDSQPAKTITADITLSVNQPNVTTGQPIHRTLQMPQPFLNFFAQLSELISGEKCIFLNQAEKDEHSAQPNQHYLLLVDDNLVNLTVAGKLLEKLGYQYDTAQNGIEALNTLKARPELYTLILLDCEMPDIDGFEVCRQWREQEVAQQLTRKPIIALTAHAMPEIQQLCEDAGMDEVLFKPIKGDNLQAVLERYPLATDK